MDFDNLTPESLLDQGLQALRDLLGPTWDVTVQPPQWNPTGEGRSLDALVQLQPDGDNVYTQLLVDLRASVTPRVVEERLLPKLDLIRQVNHFTNPVVITPWIAPRVQLMLRENGIGYIDLTGNVSLRVTRPAIVLYTEGDSRPPRSSAARSSKATLAGPKAGRLVRLLADVAPPYRAGELADAADLSLPYVSRLLDTLEDQLLIRREGRVITDVDWPELLRARAEQLNLLRHNPYVGMVAPNGIKATLKALSALPEMYSREIVLTGSYAARSVAPLAVGGQLMLYVPAGPHTPDDVGDDLGLLRVDKGADVLLLRAHDKVVFERTVYENGVHRVALSQLVLDCLSGPGRMPAEGEAVLAHMQEAPELWRAPQIPA
ncbi:helix-turn-helix domain-containing protein [Streptomyces sp. NPDC101209]|uniref:helix-turn-helix domain-containing protein n=1 Tax=Streptomyces sp. NPDC101209 TaxID=3366129 RepID=UPI00382381C7